MSREKSAKLRHSIDFHLRLDLNKGNGIGDGIVPDNRFIRFNEFILASDKRK